MKIIKILDNLTEEYVPDNKEKIFNAISSDKKTTDNQIPQRKAKSGYSLRYGMAVACCAVLVLSVLGINIYQSKSAITKERSTEKASVLPTEQNETKISNPYFNKQSMPVSKIGGIKKRSDFDAVQLEFKVNAIPFDCEYYFLYSPKEQEADPFAADITHYSENKFFSCIVSRQKFSHDIISDSNLRYTTVGNINMLLFNDSKRLYASFALGETNYLLEAEGFSETEFVELVNILIE